MQEITKHILFLGLNDQTTKKQEIDTTQAYNLVFNAIQAVNYDGCTISESTGLYKHNDGFFVIEKSLKIEILFASDDKTKKLIDDLKQKFNQESIALEIQQITSDLI